MVSSAAKRKARVRQPVTGRERQAVQRVGGRMGRAGEKGAMRAVVWPPGCPWPGVWLWPGPFGSEGPEGPGGAGARGPRVVSGGASEGSWIAIAITVAGFSSGLSLRPGQAGRSPARPGCLA